jgi:hypothetical protein
VQGFAGWENVFFNTNKKSEKRVKALYVVHSEEAMVHEVVEAALKLCTPCIPRREMVHEFVEAALKLCTWCIRRKEMVLENVGAALKLCTWCNRRKEMVLEIVEAALKLCTWSIRKKEMMLKTLVGVLGREIVLVIVGFNALETEFGCVQGAFSNSTSRGILRGKQPPFPPHPFHTGLPLHAKRRL